VGTLEYLRRQLAYDEWANFEVLAAVRATGGPSARSLRLVAHIIAAGRLWLERIKRQPQSLPVWPEFDLAECDAQAKALGQSWQEYFSTLTESSLAETVSYKNSKGEPWNSTVGDVLNHVIMHGAYHRGQIATHMRAGGQTPAYTDFIHAVRQGFIK